MFQYWKRFDLQQLQVSGSPSRRSPPVRSARPLRAEVRAGCFGGGSVGVLVENWSAALALMKVALRLIRN